MVKNIIICSDGTGNTAIKGRGTNVFKLYEAVDLEGHKTDPSKTPQVAFYDDGVGTERLRLLALLGGAFRWGLSRNVCQLYSDLARAYEPGDRIFLLGFSRGAFTVRTLAGFIATCGIIDRRLCQSDEELHEAVEAAYDAYRDRYRTDLVKLLRGPALALSESVKEVRKRWAVKHEVAANTDAEPWQARIVFIGVWDTVDAVGFPVPWVADFFNSTFRRFKFPDRRLSPLVNRACHALAIDDERRTFHPVLWDEKGETTGRIEQVWFAGVHSNVGGGYPKQGMSLVSLVWMMEEAHRAGLRFCALDWQLYHERQNVYDKLYNSRAGLAFFYRYRPRDVDRMCRDHHVLPKVHASAIERVVQGPEGYAPGNIPRDSHIVGEHNPVLNVIVQSMQNHLSPDRSLLDRVRGWITLRVCFQYLLIGLVALLVLMALWGGMARPDWSVSELLSVSGLTNALASFVIGAILGARWYVLALLVTMLVAYGVGWLGNSMMRRVFSEFWCRVRP